MLPERKSGAKDLDAHRSRLAASGRRGGKGLGEELPEACAHGND